MREEDLSRRAAEMGEWLRVRLREAIMRGGKVKEVRGKGLLNGIEINKDAGTAHQYVKALLKLGVLCKDTASQVMRNTPPLIITKEEAEWGIERIAKALG
jgi:ornithine--oxo-acid transaminase